MANSTTESVGVSKNVNYDCPVCIIIWLFLKKFAPIGIAVLVTGFVFLMAGIFIFCWFKRRRRPYFPERSASSNDYAIPYTSTKSKPVPVAVRRLSLPKSPEATKREKIPKSHENRVSSMYMDVEDINGRGRESTTDPEPDYIHAVLYPPSPLQRMSSGYDNNVEIESLYLSEDPFPNPLDKAGGNLTKIIPNGSTGKSPLEPDYVSPKGLGTTEKIRVENDLDSPTMPVWDTTVIRGLEQENTVVSVDPEQLDTSSCIDPGEEDQTDSVALQQDSTMSSVHQEEVNTSFTFDSEQEVTPDSTDPEIEETTGSINEEEEDIKDLPPPPVIARMPVIGSDQEELVWPRPPSFLDI